MAETPCGSGRSRRAWSRLGRDGWNPGLWEDDGRGDYFRPAEPPAENVYFLFAQPDRTLASTHDITMMSL
jgi:hypothetical protein